MHMPPQRPSDPTAKYRSALEADPGLLTAADASAAAQDGHALVREREEFLRRFIVLPRHTLLPLTLWELGTFCFESFELFPYLTLTSPVRECAKTRLLAVLSLLVRSQLSTVNISEAALFRAIAEYRPTLLMDEMEALNQKGERAQYLRNLINAGNRSDATTHRCGKESHKLEVFNVYCPKALAAIGALPETISSRSIIIPMQRRKPSDAIGRFLRRKVRAEADALRERGATWIRAHKSEIEAAYDRLDLEFLEDRDAELWEPLFAVLAVADPVRLAELRTSAEALTQEKRQAALEDSLLLRLLADIRQVWKDREHAVFSADLVARLKGVADSPWEREVELTPRRLARMLKGFGIASGSVRIGEATGKGYYRDAFEEAFASYLR